METREPSPNVAKPYEPNAVLRWLYRRFFAHISVDQRWSASVTDAASRGVPVYIMRSISFLDFLCLDFLTKQFGLPLIRFVNDLGLWILEPFGKGRRRLRLRRQIAEDQALRETVADHGSALLFLRRPPGFGKVRRHGEELEVDLIRTLVETQKTMEAPILLVPQTFVWTKLPPHREHSVWDLLFGPREWPGRIRVCLQFILNYRNALLRSGEPFDLKDFVSRNADLTVTSIADKVRYALLTRMERERTLVVGPEWKTPTRIRTEIIRSPRVREQIEAEAERTNKPVSKVEVHADKELRRLCAMQDPTSVRYWHVVLDYAWNRIYDGMEVDKAGLERLRDAARKGPLVLMPSHKSHVDYLVLSDVLYTHDMSPPLIAAGENLGFWPLGTILRRGGAFFIRRSFQGKKLYSALVAAYMRKLLAEGFNIEFFLEGGRSRTGKLLSPKFGLLSMVVDAAFDLPGRQIQFVPISIGYERIIEARSYVDELTGGEKREENIGGLLRTPKILRSKYGRLYVQVGEILPFDRFREEMADEGDDPSPSKRRALVQKIAHQVVHQINQVTVVTPASLVALALLTQERDGLGREELLHRARLMMAVLADQGARFASSLRNEQGQLRAETVDEALRLFMDGKLVVEGEKGDETTFTVPEERRIALEYFKNNVLHFFVASALIAVAAEEQRTDSLDLEALRARVLTFSKLFKYEFMFRADAPFDEIFDDALTGMVRRGELVRDAAGLRVAEGGRHMIALHSEIVRTYFESYRLAFRGAELLLEEEFTRKEWIKRTLSVGQRMYLAGELLLRESLSKPRLENALKALADLQVVHADGETLAKGGEATDVQCVRDLGARLSTFPGAS